MNEMVFSLNNGSYSFRTPSGKHEYPVGSLLISFAEMNLHEFLQDVRAFREEDTYHFLLDHGSVEIEEYYSDLCTALSLQQQGLGKKYNPVLVQLLVNGLEAIEQDYILNGDGFTDASGKRVNAWFLPLMELQNSLHDIVVNPGLTVDFAKKTYQMFPHIDKYENIRCFHDFEGDETVLLYAVSDPISFILFETYETALEHVVIRKCKNCGRLFVPINRSDETYCSRILENGKTCHDVGYDNTIDDFQKCYRKLYKTLKARCRQHAHDANYAERHVAPLLRAAAVARDSFRSDGDLEGFERWIKVNKDAY